MKQERTELEPLKARQLVSVLSDAIHSYRPVCLTDFDLICLFLSVNECKRLIGVIITGAVLFVTHFGFFFKTFYPVQSHSTCLPWAVRSLRVQVSDHHVRWRKERVR